MQTESRTHRALLNSFWSVLGYAIPIVVTIFVTPIIVFGLGEEQYGLYAFFMSAIAVLGILDLGVSTSVSRHITEYHGRGESHRLRDLIKSANTIAFLIGIVGFVACVAIGTIGDALITGAVASHALGYYILTGLVFLVNSASLVYIVIPNALQRFDVNTGVGTTLLAISLGANVFAVKAGYGVTGLLLVQLGLSIVTTLAYRIYSHRLLPGVATFRFGWSKTDIKGFYSFGFKAFGASVGSSSMSYLGRLIIPLFLGPAALTYYSVPGNVASKVPGITTALAGVLFPLATNLSTRGESDLLNIAYVRSFRLISIISAAMVTAIVAFAGPILLYWLDAAFAAQSKTVLILISLASFWLALYVPLYNFLMGIGRLRMVTIASFVMGGVNAVALFVLLPLYGIDGAAWAYLISTAPILYMIYHTEKHYLGLAERKAHYLSLFAKMLVCAAMTYALSKLVLIPLTSSLATLAITGPLAVLAYLAFYRIFGFFESEDLRDLSAFVRKIFRRSA